MSRGAALALVGVLLLAGCGADDGASSSTAGGGSTDVATADLVRLKQQAQMPDCPPSDRSAAPVDDGLPDATLPCLGGGRDVRLAGLDGPLVLNVWASYCAPCREELPVLQQLHEAAGDDLTVLGLDYEDPAPAAALKLAADAGVTFPSVADPEASVRADLEVIALPQTVFVDTAGTVAAVERTKLESFDMAADLVRRHLGVDVAASAS